jgi:predicted ester cyclase
MVDGSDLVRRYLEEVFSEGNVGAMDRYLAGVEFQKGVAELVTRWRTAFPDFRLEVLQTFVAGDRVITVEAMSGTHDGVFESRLGPIAPTGRHVRWSRICIRRLDGDRFADGFFEEDGVALLEQLGVLGTNLAGPNRGRHSPLSDVR